MIAIALVIAFSGPVALPEVPRARVHQAASDTRHPEEANQPDRTAEPIAVTVYTQKSPEELQAEREDREKDRAIQADMARFNEQLVWVGVVSVGLTAVAAAAAILAAVYGGKSARIADRALRVAQRSYVGPSEWKAAWQDDVGFVVNFKYKNSGRIPANIVEVHYSYADTAPPEPPTYAHRHSRPGIVLPDAHKIQPIICSAISKSDADAILSGKRRFFFWMKASYRDQLITRSDADREFGVCVTYDATDKKLVETSLSGYVLYT